MKWWFGALAWAFNPMYLISCFDSSSSLQLLPVAKSNASFSNLIEAHLNLEQKKQLRTIQVVYVYDGDTFRDQQGQWYRLIGLDTPEIKIKHSKRQNQGLDKFYAFKARDFLKEIIDNQQVQIIKVKKDHYNRWVVRLFKNNKDINLSLVSQGLAKVSYLSHNKKDQKYYYHDFHFIQKMYEVEKQAQIQALNIWSN